MDKVLPSIVMGISIRESFKIIRSAGMELNSIPMAIYMLDLSGRIKNMAKAHSTGLISVHQHAPKMQG
jgi:hypothetical protein